MGVHNLMRLIYENARGAVSEARVADYRNKRVAIDANIYVYKCMAQRPFYTGRHIVRMLRLARWLHRRQIEPLFVFDNQKITLGAKDNERYARRARKRRNMARHKDVLCAISLLRCVRERCVHVARLAQFTYIDSRLKAAVGDALLFALEDAEHAFLPRKLIQRCANDLCAQIETTTRMRNRRLAPLHLLLRWTTLASSEKDWVDVNLAPVADVEQRKQIIATFVAMCEHCVLGTAKRASERPPSTRISNADNDNQAHAQQNIFLDRDGELLLPATNEPPSAVTFCAMHFESFAEIPQDLPAQVERCWQALLHRLCLDGGETSDQVTLPAILPVLYCTIKSETDLTSMTCIAPCNADTVTQIDSAIKIFCSKQRALQNKKNIESNAQSTVTLQSSNAEHKNESLQSRQSPTERSLQRIVRTLAQNMPSMTNSQSTSTKNVTKKSSVSTSHSSSTSPSKESRKRIVTDRSDRRLRSTRSASALLQFSRSSTEENSANVKQHFLECKTLAKSEPHDTKIAAHIKSRLVHRTSSRNGTKTQFFDEEKHKKAHCDRLQTALDAQGGAWAADTALLTEIAALPCDETFDAPTAKKRQDRKPLLHRTHQCARKRTIVALNDAAQQSHSLDETLHRLAWIAVSLEAQTVRVHYDQVDQVKQALRYAGEHVIDAPHEAEQHCSYLCASGAADAVMSDDTDVVPFGALRVLRKCRFAHNAGDESVFAQLIDCEALQNAWRMTRAQLVDLCILIGCDFCTSLRDVSARRVFHCFLQNRCSLEETLRALPPHCVAPLRTPEAASAIERARAIFLGNAAQEPSENTEDANAHQPCPNRTALRRFLSKHQCLHRAREFLPNQNQQDTEQKPGEDTLSASRDDSVQQ